MLSKFLLRQFVVYHSSVCLTMHKWFYTGWGTWCLLIWSWLLSPQSLQSYQKGNLILSPHRWVKDNVYTSWSFAPNGDPDTHLYLILRHYPLGLDLLNFLTPRTSRADLHTRSSVSATLVAPLLIVPSTSSNVRSCLSIPSRLLTPETQLLNASTNETCPSI